MAGADVTRLLAETARCEPHARDRALRCLFLFLKDTHPKGGGPRSRLTNGLPRPPPPHSITLGARAPDSRLGTRAYSPHKHSVHIRFSGAGDELCPGAGPVGGSAAWAS